MLLRTLFYLSYCFLFIVLCMLFSSCSLSIVLLSIALNSSYQTIVLFIYCSFIVLITTTPLCYKNYRNFIRLVKTITLDNLFPLPPTT